MEFKINSNLINVFPTVKREQVESKKLTEARIVKLVNRFINQDGFVITPTETTIEGGEFEFNIHGYRFTIEDISEILEEFEDSTYLWAYITLLDLDSKKDAAYTVLNSLDDDDRYYGLIFTDKKPEDKYRVLLLSRPDSLVGWTIPASSRFRFIRKLGDVDGGDVGGIHVPHSFSIGTLTHCSINGPLPDTIWSDIDLVLQISLDSGYMLTAESVKVIGALSSYRVSGNNIILSGASSDISISIEAVLAPVYYTISNILHYCTTDNQENNILEHSAYTAILTTNSDYIFEVIPDIHIFMGDEDITDSCINISEDYHTITITIEDVTGNINISATAIKEVHTYTISWSGINILPISQTIEIQNSETKTISYTLIDGAFDERIAFTGSADVYLDTEAKQVIISNVNSDVIIVMTAMVSTSHAVTYHLTNCSEISHIYTVEDNSTLEVIITAEDGYTISGIDAFNLNGTGGNAHIRSYEDSVLIIDNITSDIEIYCTATKIVTYYTISWIGVGVIPASDTRTVEEGGSCEFAFTFMEGKQKGTVQITPADAAIINDTEYGKIKLSNISDNIVVLYSAEDVPSETYIHVGCNNNQVEISNVEDAIMPGESRIITVSNIPAGYDIYVEALNGEISELSDIFNNVTSFKLTAASGMYSEIDLAINIHNNEECHESTIPFYIVTFLKDSEGNSISPTYEVVYPAGASNVSVLSYEGTVIDSNIIICGFIKNEAVSKSKGGSVKISFHSSNFNSRDYKVNYYFPVEYNLTNCTKASGTDKMIPDSTTTYDIDLDAYIGYELPDDYI